MLNGNPSGGEDGYSSNWSYPCDACHAAASELYCSTDSTYLCRRCDLHLHAAIPLTFHERVWVDNAPAAFTCLAYSDEVETPSANLLVPMTPPWDSLYASSTTHLEADHGLFPGTEHGCTPNKSNDKLQAEADSWLLFDLDNDNQTDNSGTTQRGKEVDESLNFLKYNSYGEYQYHLDQTDQLEFSTSQDLNRYSGDRVVPVQPLDAVQEQQQQQQQIFFDRKHEPSKDTLMYAAPTSQRVPLSFINPAYLFSASTSDTLNSYSSFLQGTDLFPNPSLSLPLPFGSIDREASVLRYREKRRLRKYHKKIRYASRKVNAENRQRVKGRFAGKKKQRI